MTSLSPAALFLLTPICHAGFQTDVTVSPDGKTVATSQGRVLYNLVRRR